MVNPVTVNAGIIVPLTGADVDLWGEDDVNPNMVAIDGLLCGVQTVAVTNVPVTLTKPAGFTATPSPGPTQSQNRVLRFTGVMSADVRITLPIPGVYVIDNSTTGNFVLSFQGVTATEVIAIKQGTIEEIYNDGANVRFIGLGKVGELEFWGGLIAMPAWVAACTKKPYLLADAVISNFSDYPYLGNEYGANFGGNGITTFGVPDLRGRVPLAYDGTGARITVAGCGLNGQTMGAFIDSQSVGLTAAQIPSITSTGNNLISVRSNNNLAFGGNTQLYQGGTNGPVGQNGVFSIMTSSDVNTINVTSNNTGGQAHPNVQPSLVAGIYVVKT